MFVVSCQLSVVVLQKHRGFYVTSYELRGTGYRLRGMGCFVASYALYPLKKRFALGALPLKSVPSELETFLPQGQRSSSETLIKRSAP
jgi:hypothetical protein